MRQLVTVPLLLGSERESYRSAIFSFSSYCNPSPWCAVAHKQGRAQLTALTVCLLDGSKSSQVGSQFRSRAHSSVQVMLQTLGWHGSRQGWVLCSSFPSFANPSHHLFPSHPGYHPIILTHPITHHPIHSYSLFKSSPQTFPSGETDLAYP